MQTLLTNKKAWLNYEIVETYEAGIELHGFEVKTLRAKQGSLNGTHVTVRGGEAYLLHAHIPAYQPANAPDTFDSQRNRRLLLTKKEIQKLASEEDKKNLTIVPLTVYNKNRRIKVEIAVVKGKKKHDKRQKIKEEDTKRDMEREMKDTMR